MIDLDHDAMLKQMNGRSAESFVKPAPPAKGDPPPVPPPST